MYWIVLIVTRMVVVVKWMWSAKDVQKQQTNVTIPPSCRAFHDLFVVRLERNVCCLIAPRQMELVQFVYSWAVLLSAMMELVFMFTKWLIALTVFVVATVRLANAGRTRAIKVDWWTSHWNIHRLVKVWPYIMIMVSVTRSYTGMNCNCCYHAGLSYMHVCI